MSGKPYFTWMPEQLEFVRAHAGYDMTPREIASYYRCPEDHVHAAIRGMGLKYTLQKLTALHTPYATVIAVGIRKATAEDEYEPESLWDNQVRRFLEDLIDLTGYFQR